MKGLKIIPYFLVLIILSYIGVLFVQLNPSEVVVVFFRETETPPLALGFVVLTSALVGMLFAGVLCLLELVVLYVQNKNMRNKLRAYQNKYGQTEEESVFGTTATRKAKVALGGNGNKTKLPEKTEEKKPAPKQPEAKP